MRCVAYVRVSAKELDESNQVNAIAEFAKAKGIEVVKTYIDKGESGAKAFKDRPAAAQLLAELNELKPDCLLAWALDRIGRNMLDTMNTVLELEERGVRVITLKEEFLQSLDPNIRKLILSIMAWVAEYERRRIRERAEEAWRQGKPKGRPPKVPDNVIRAYLAKYYPMHLSLKSIWKIMKADGHNLSYSRFVRRARKILQELNIAKQQ